MKILVTGAGGLLGGRIIDFLQQRGHNIIAISRSYRGHESWKDKVQIIHADIGSTEDLSSYMNGVAAVIHTAGMNAGDAFNDPPAALHFNGYVTAKLLQNAVKYNVRQFIYLSSANLYGSKLNGIVNEDSPATNLHPYATSHQAGENAILFAHHTNKIKGTILRLSNAFGSPINHEANCWMLLANDLCRQSVINGNLRLYTTGKQYKNFISITEVCKAIHFLINLEYHEKDYPLVNIASKNVISVMDMAKIIQDRAIHLFGYEIPLLYPESEQQEDEKPFILETRILDQLNYTISDDLITEIDLLLTYCKKTFGVSII
ncbi:MAG: SDR family oxidoreductase [Hydrotalea sp.]|nr:SDR family oxidoreductase [Hydrotalea sp.]